MSEYYYLLNDTKRESVHLAGRVKRGQLENNEAVHFALCNYMLTNLGDSMRLCSDYGDEGLDYSSVDLLTYKFEDPKITVMIVARLNVMHGFERYAVVNGVGVETLRSFGSAATS